MRTARPILWLLAAGFVGFGVAFLLAPAALAARVGIVLTSPDARADLMAGYGGVQLGLGLFLARSTRSSAAAGPGLQAAGLALAGFALARLAGILTGGPVSALVWLLLGVEGTGAVLALWGHAALTADARRSS